MRRRRPLPNAEQLLLFGGPPRAPAPPRAHEPCDPLDPTEGAPFRGRSEPPGDDVYDAWLYPRSKQIGGAEGRVPPTQTCTWSGKEKAASRDKQRELWLSGWRPQTPPLPYRPEPAGHPARTYKEADKDGKLKDVLRPDLDYDPDVRAYDKILVQFSGGKDSVACLLYVIELCCEAGIDPAERIECWHQCVDGDPRPIREGRGPNGERIPVPKQYIWDWPCTEDYCVKVCSYLGIPLLFQWRTGGITGGVFQYKGDPPATVGWEEPEEGQALWTRRQNSAPPPGYRVRCKTGLRPEKGSPFGKPRKNNRLRWPSIGKINQGRYCSSYVKIEPFNMSFRHSARFDGLRVLVVTGERAEESSNRATYKAREFDKKAGHGTQRQGSVPTKPHMVETLSQALGRTKASLRKEKKQRLEELWTEATGRSIPPPRYVEGWKAVLDWCEIEVWAIMARHGLRPHPAYSLGFGRLSCVMCIFSSKSQFETIRSTTAQGARTFDKFVKAEVALAAIQDEAKKHPGNWNEDDFKTAIPTIKSDSEKVGRKKITVPVPLDAFVDTPDREGGPEYAAIIADELVQGGVPQEVIDYHAHRAEGGLPVAYPASVVDCELAESAWREHLPPNWNPVDERWRDPSYLPSGAFGEDEGPS